VKKSEKMFISFRFKAKQSKKCLFRFVLKQNEKSGSKTKQNENFLNATQSENMVY
jgi:hypothetical protein